MSALAELFPDADYRFHLTLRRGEPRDFFAPQDPTGRMLAERRRWLDSHPGRHAQVTAEGVPLLAEFAALCAGWGVARAGGLAQLGAELEPDFLLLSADADGAFRLRGGVLCFPTGWALEEKLGHTVEFIHGVVPGLNPALGAPINQFLSRLRPGAAYLRDNWGLAATDELNLHPGRRGELPTFPAIGEAVASIALDRVWLRVEHQALMALPQTGGIVFGIRIALHRLDEVARDRAAAAGLARALRSMPADLAAYKRIDGIRAAVLTAISE